MKSIIISESYATMFKFLLFTVCLSATLFFVKCEEDYEGSSCMSNGTAGQCVNIHRCWGAVRNITKKIYPPICTFQDNTPVICCTDCELVEDTRLLVFNPLLGLLKKTGTSRAKDKCLDFINALNYTCKNDAGNRQILDRWDSEKKCIRALVSIPAVKYVFNGRNALREEFPHMALLGYGDTMDSAVWLCGGTLISERFILTAGHCIYNRRVGSVKYVALGILSRSDPPELWQRFNVKRAITHPGYKPPSKYHDIALLETDKQIPFSRAVLPACLHVDEKIDDRASVTGWGSVGQDKGLADVLQSAMLKKFTDEECSEQYQPYRNLINGYDRFTQICYGDDKNKSSLPTDTCEGDSGGPLQSRNHEQCVFTILGVTSFGRQCGMKGASGIYTRVKYYVPWIEDIVWP